MKKETVTGRDRTLYQQMVSEAMPKKPMLPQLLKAFGAKMFTIAGPVLVYGIGSSVIYGILYLIFHRG